MLGAKESRMLLLVVWSLLLYIDVDVSARGSTTCKVKAVFKPRGYSKSLQNTGMIPHYLNCSVERGKIASQITWKIQNQVLKQALRPTKWLGLTLNKAVVRRVGDVRCEVIVGNKNRSCGFVQEAPPRITSRKHEYEAYVGTPLVIPCRATGSPIPVTTWIKTAESLATQDMLPSIKQVRSHGGLDLVFKKISMVHRGIYKCHAVNRLGKDTYFVIVTPLYYSIPRPPRVVPLHHVVTVSKGYTAVLVCSAKHTPRHYTALFWDHRGNRVTNTVRHHIKSRYSERIVKKKYKDERVKMSLSIGHVGFKDVGLYTCGVVTGVGRHESHVELRIKE